MVYGSALADYRSGNYQRAKQQLQPLLDNDPNNIWYIDLMTDIDLNTNNNNAAINRLQAALKKSPNSSALQLNLANAYVKNKNYQQAVSLLHRYTFDHNDDTNGWELLISAYGGSHSRAQEMSAQAELIALEGQFQRSIQILQNAKNQTKGDQIMVSRIEARIKQLQQLQQRYAQYSKR